LSYASAKNPSETRALRNSVKDLHLFPQAIFLAVDKHIAWIDKCATEHHEKSLSRSRGESLAVLKHFATGMGRGQDH
jgi:hypothetical protein